VKELSRVRRYVAALQAENQKFGVAQAVDPKRRSGEETARRDGEKAREMEMLI
jgi:hypothetical protein